MTRECFNFDIKLSKIKKLQLKKIKIKSHGENKNDRASEITKKKKKVK